MTGAETTYRWPSRHWLVGLVLLLLTAVPVQAADDSKLPSDLALVPQYGDLFISVRAADLMNGDLGKQLRSQLDRGRDQDDLLSQWRKDFGVPPTEVERLTFVPPDVWIVRTVRPYDREKLIDAVAPAAQRIKVGKHTVYQGRNSNTGIYMVDERTFVKVPTMLLRELGRLRAGGHGAGALSEALGLASHEHSVVVGVVPMAVLESWYTLGSAEARPAVQRKPTGVGPQIVPPPSAPVTPKDTPPQPSSEQEQDEAQPVTRQARPNVQDILNVMPPGWLPYRPLLEARLVTVAADLGTESRAQVRATFASATAAQEGQTALKTALYVVRHLLPRMQEEVQIEPQLRQKLQPLFRDVQTAVARAKVQRQDHGVTAAMKFEVHPATVAALALQIRGQATRTHDANNLKQIGLAFHNFHDTNGAFPPPAIYSKDGKPLLSWRVAILPYIEEDKLYRQFHLNEPWDSPHNKKLLARMPAVYASVTDKPQQPYTTRYQVFTGPQAPFQLQFIGRGPFNARGPKIANFLDGTSNTLLVAESAHAVPWTSPEDMPYDAMKSLPKLARSFSGGSQAVFADGAIRLLPADLDEQTLRNLIMPADGNVIDWNKIDRAQGGHGPGAAEPPPPPPPPPPTLRRKQ